MDAYLPIGMLLILALIVCTTIYGLTTWLGPKNPIASKLSPYECGLKTEDDARTPFRIGFYLIAVLFLLFDVEAAFFFPWALVYRESIATDASLLIALIIYSFFMVVGLVYIIQKDCLNLK